jgi:hypothetical protein
LQTPEQKTNLLHFHAKTAYWWPFWISNFS